MISNYNQYKYDILESYDSFHSLIMEIKGERRTNFDSGIITMEKRAANIRANKFLLMVTGEAKSGKSTFINAYLGKEILPMDVMQCSSAIVEIAYGEQFVLKATYADDREEILDTEDAIRSFLLKNAAMDDDHRDVPVSIINMGLIAPRRGRPIPNSEIDEWVAKYRTNDYYKEDKIKAYIQEAQVHWQSIVTKIEIQYPFDDEDMKSIRIVDTPGVNAEGELGRITDEYMDNADALIFLKPMGSGALEANSFRSFLQSRGANRSKGAKFLVLTHRGAVKPRERVHAQLDEAKRQFPDINPKQIIAVDSRIELYWNKLHDKTIEEIETFVEEGVMDGHIDDGVSSAYMISHHDREKFLDTLKAFSNFSDVDDALNRFAHKAQYIALSELLSIMNSVAEKAIANLEENIDNRKMKLSNPDELANELLNKKAQIDILRQKINISVDEIVAKYCNGNGIIDTEAEAVIARFLDDIEKIDPNMSQSVDCLEELSKKQIENYKAYQESLRKELVKDCDDSLVEFSTHAKISFDRIAPIITPEDIAEIKSDALKNNTYLSGNTFSKRKGTKAVVNQPMYFSTFKNHIINVIQQNKLRITSDLRDYAGDITSQYRTELTKNLVAIREEYEQLLSEKRTYDEQVAEIERLEKQSHAAKLLADRIKQNKEGVDRNV